ncbi:MAG: HAMP domain-containing sensor histidine kinase [Bacteroidetes bacterium]|nr:HAMP domain-containing sensor histidine kinase [Bacteroidota bacterium]
MRIKLVIRNLFLTFLLLLIGASSFSQLPYTIERLNTESGLPTNTIKGLQFDEKHRFLWIATESGIVRYNGHNVQSFGDQEEKSILSNRVVYFTISNNGTLFGKFVDATSFSIKENDVIIGKTTSIDNNLNEFIENKYNVNLSKIKTNYKSLYFKTFKINNIIFSINEDYLLHFNNTTVDTLLSFDSKVQSFQIGDRLYIIDEKNILSEVLLNNIANASSKVLVKKVFHSEKYFKISTDVKVFQDLPMDDVFIITDQKLYRISLIDNNFSFELVLDNLPISEYYKFVQFDKITQTIYIGTDNRGVLVCRPKYFNRILPNNTLLNTSTSAYAQVLLKNGNIQVNDGAIFGSAKLSSSIIFDKKSETNTFISSKNILYFTNEDGIVEYDLTNNKVINKFKDFTRRNAFIEVNNTMYAINGREVIKKNNLNEWFSVIKFSWIPTNFMVYDVKQENDQELLVATTDGMYKYNLNKNTFKLFYRDKSKANFRSIYKMDDYFLLGTYGGGVYMYKQDTIKKMPLDPNGYLKYVHCFIEDDEHNIWASSNKGLFRSPKQSVKDFWNFGPGKIAFRYFGKIDGIDVLEMNGGCSPCAIKLPNGDFSIPGIDGLIQFNPDNLNKLNYLNIKPNVYLDKIIIDNKITSFEDFNKALSRKTKSIDFQLGISGMLSEENVIVEYKFGLNENWKRITIKNPNIHLDKTSFGQNDLYLRCRNTASADFGSIDYPFYVNYPNAVHPLMILVYFLIIILLIYLYVRIKTAIYHKRQKELESEVNLKTKSLTSINKYLTERNQAKEQVLAIMNHDVLTPLKYLHMTANSINEKIVDADLKKSIQQIASTSKELEYLTRNMLNWVKFDNTNKLLNSQEVDIHKLIYDLIDFITPFIEGKDIILENKIPIDTKIKNWPEALRVLMYNILMNAIKSTEKGVISISIEESKSGYIIKVQDTGVGMSASMAKYLITGKSKDEVENLPKYKKGNGVGYQIIRNIIKLMKAKLEIDSIENKGTTVRIFFVS